MTPSARCSGAPQWSDRSSTWERSARAAERLSAAASRAIARSDTAATENLSRRAAALRAPDDPQRAWDLMALGWILGDADRATEMTETFDEALALAETTGDERAIAL